MTLIKTRTTTVIEEGQDEGDDENDQQRGSDSGSARAQTNSDGEAQNDSVQSGLEMVRGWLMDKREGYLDERAQLHDKLQNLDRTERGMHTVLELTSNPVVAQTDPEQCREGRERLAEVVRNNTIAEDRSGDCQRGGGGRRGTQRQRGRALYRAGRSDCPLPGRDCGS